MTVFLAGESRCFFQKGFYLPSIVETDTACTNEISYRLCTGKLLVVWSSKRGL